MGTTEIAHGLLGKYLIRTLFNSIRSRVAQERHAGKSSVDPDKAQKHHAS